MNIGSSFFRLNRWLFFETWCTWPRVDVASCRVSAMYFYKLLYHQRLTWSWVTELTPLWGTKLSVNKVRHVSWIKYKQCRSQKVSRLADPSTQLRQDVSSCLILQCEFTLQAVTCSIVQSPCLISKQACSHTHTKWRFYIECDAMIMCQVNVEHTGQTCGLFPSSVAGAEADWFHCDN